MLNRFVTGGGFHALLPKLACLALIAASAVPAWAQQGVTLARDGRPVAKIYMSQRLDIPHSDAKALRAMSREARATYQLESYQASAVKDFIHHVQLMSGATLEVVTTDNPADVKPPAIVVGQLAIRMGATARHETIVKESYRLLARDGLLLVGGESEIGVSHGLYTLLYQMGCDWLFPGDEGIVAPHQPTLALPAMDQAAKPDFEVRAPWYSGGRNIVTVEEVQAFDQWKQRQRQSPPPVFGSARVHPLFMSGGHFWASLINANKKLLTEKPELRALVRQPDGSLERGWFQLEPTHPEVIDMTVEWVKAQYESLGLPKDAIVSFSIGPNDGGGYSVSPEALAAGVARKDPVTGDDDQTDVLILYANKVLEKLKPEYPNVHLGFYIYSVHGDYPQRYVPDSHFVGNIADITYSRYHSTLDDRSPTRTYFRNIIEQWGELARKQGNPLWFYGYNWNLAENLMPYSKLKIWGQDLPWYHRQGVRGHNNEQDKAWSILGPHNYLMARMGWDLSLDWKDILKEYTRKAFGDGAPFMEAYYLDLIATQEAGGSEAGGYAAIPLIFNRDFITRNKARFAQAMQAAGTPEHRRNVDYFGQAVTALEIYLDYRDAITHFDFPRAQQQFERMEKHFNTYMEKNSQLVSRYGWRYVNNWLIKPYVTQALQYTTGDHKLLHAIPDELPTIFDPNIAGHLMGFQHVSLPDDKLVKFHTWGSAWDAQGIAWLRDGAIWHRIWFDVDTTPPAGQGVGLFLGAFEDRAHVWCNGQYVGNARGYIRPAAFDLTGFIKPGQKNLIAIQIIRTGKLNELATGGLLYPSFVFTGPRLEKVAPDVVPLERILPGGARE